MEKNWSIVKREKMLSYPKNYTIFHSQHNFRKTPLFYIQTVYIFFFVHFFFKKTNDCKIVAVLGTV